MPNVEPAPLAPPNFGVALTCPAIHADEDEERLAALRAASDRDWLVDYGDLSNSTSFRPLVNPELSGTWTSGSTARSCRAVRAIASGMGLQCDIIPSPAGPGRALNCDDGVVVADAALRDAIAERHPEAWKRMVARQRFMRDALGTEVAMRCCRSPRVPPISRRSAESVVRLCQRLSGAHAGGKLRSATEGA